jgi:hypothetical protein
MLVENSEVAHIGANQWTKMTHSWLGDSIETS